MGGKGTSMKYLYLCREIIVTAIIKIQSSDYSVS